MHTGWEGERKRGREGECEEGSERRWNRGRDGKKMEYRKQLAIDGGNYSKPTYMHAKTGTCKCQHTRTHARTHAHTCGCMNTHTYTHTILVFRIHQGQKDIKYNSMNK